MGSYTFMGSLDSFCLTDKLPLLIALMSSINALTHILSSDEGIEKVSSKKRFV